MSQQISILGKAGDHLPNYKIVQRPGKTKTGRQKKKVIRVLAEHKDGESPGQEWTRRETLAIRTLANPKTSTRAAAAKAAKVTPATIDRWLRNPYFQNEIFRITNSQLMNYRTQVIGSLIAEAASGNVPAQNLFFKLTGDLKDEKRIKAESHAHHTFGEMSDTELDRWIKDDIRDGTDINRLLEE